MEIRENVSLAQYTTWRIGGDARFFCDVVGIDDLKKAYEFAESKNIPVLIIGGGSNMLISDKGWNGLVARMQIKGKDTSNKDKGIIKIGAGENWDKLVGFCVEEGLYGLENLSLIPGTVGAAPVQNIGAYGVEIAQFIEVVEVFDTHSKTMRSFTRDDCKFSYRDSAFKHEEAKHYVITSITLQLSTEEKVNTSYKDIAAFYAAHPDHPKTPQGVRQAVINIRTEKLPDIKEFGTAGSFWKNPIILKSQYDELLKKFPEIPSYPVNDTHVKIPLAWVLDRVCGAKGRIKGNIGIYKTQALVLVNLGGATYEEVDQFAREMEESVKEKTNVMVEREVICID